MDGKHQLFLGNMRKRNSMAVKTRHVWCIFLSIVHGPVGENMHNYYARVNYCNHYKWIVETVKARAIDL